MLVYLIRYISNILIRSHLYDEAILSLLQKAQNNLEITLFN